MVEIIGCPVSTTLRLIGKKWTINIINDILFGKTRFSEIMEANHNLTPKVLSERLKDLERHKIIVKELITITPIKIEYYLTKKGKNLNKILYELALFAALNEPEDVLDDPEAPIPDVINTIAQMYHFSDEEIQMYLELDSIASREQELLNV